MQWIGGAAAHEAVPADLPNVADGDLPFLIQNGGAIELRIGISLTRNDGGGGQGGEHGQDGIDLGAAEAGDEGIELVSIILAGLSIGGDEAGSVGVSIIVDDGDVGGGEAEGEEDLCAQVAGDEEAIALIQDDGIEVVVGEGGLECLPLGRAWLGMLARVFRVRLQVSQGTGLDAEQCVFFGRHGFGGVIRLRAAAVVGPAPAARRRTPTRFLPADGTCARAQICPGATAHSARPTGRGGAHAGRWDR